MFFISKKVFENELYRRMEEIESKNRIYERLDRHEKYLEEMRYKLMAIEEQNKMFRANSNVEYTLTKE